MYKISFKAGHIFMVSILVLSFQFSAYTAHAAALTSRSVKVGSSLPSPTTTHAYNFTLGSVSPVGSIEFEYCSNTPFVGSVCTAPTGLNAANATLLSQTGETGFTINPIGNGNRVVLSRTSVPTSAIPVEYTFSNIVNHSASNSTVYVRIATYASSNATGPRTDSDAVAFATVSKVTVNGYVPPYLVFCVGVTVALNCSSSSGVFLDFGELRTTQPRALSSQFSVATNDPAGYSTFVAGPTMTSGNNIITSSETPRPSQTGISQFGMNLRANSNPSVGSNPVGVGTGAITSEFNSPNQFSFKNQIVAASPISSDFNTFTVSYVVNVSSEQQPGIYSTTLTYIATAAF